MEDLNIRHFKLANGEDIIGIVSSKNKDSWLLERPVLVNSNMLGGYSFSPWFPFSSTKVHKILFSNIINSTGIDPDVKESYLQFVLDLKKNLHKIKSNHQLLAEMEEQIGTKMDELFEEGDLLDNGKKKTIH